MHLVYNELGIWHKKTDTDIKQDICLGCTSCRSAVIFQVTLCLAVLRIGYLKVYLAFWVWKCMTPHTALHLFTGIWYSSVKTRDTGPRVTTTTTTTTTISGIYDARAGDGHVWLQWGKTAGTGHGQEDYTAVSVWLWDDKRSTSISGIVNSSMTLSAYSMEEVWDNRLLREDCFRRTSASVAVSPYRVSRPWRKALTTRIWKQKQTRKTYKIKNNHKGRIMLKKTSTCLEFWFTQNDCSYPVVSCCGSWALPALPMWPSNIHLNKIWAHTLLSLYHTVIILLKCIWKWCNEEPGSIFHNSTMYNHHTSTANIWQHDA